MMTVDELMPMVDAARQICDQTRRDTDKNLRDTAEKAYNETLIAAKHALLYERRMFEAEAARSYALTLSVLPGMGRQAEFERLRADTLYQQALRHQKESEKLQEHGDQLEVEALVILRNRTQGAPVHPAPAAAAAAPAPPVRRHRDLPAGTPEAPGFVDSGPGGDGDGDGQ
jgi:hypothetical protein